MNEVTKINLMQSERVPKVSVCVVTYNQEKFIRQCVQSIVEQITDFDFEVIIGDDCSTDGTRKIVQEFADSYAEIVRVIDQETNTGGMGNYLAVHRAARGVYVCHVDGDDWIAPGKLVKQVRFLDLHREIPLVAHRMAIWNDGRPVGVTRRNPKLITLSELLRHHPMFLHSSIMYRKHELSRLFELKSIFIDFYVYITATLQGNIGFINEVLGNYRANIGVSNTRKLMPYIQAAIDLAAHNVGETPDISRCRSRQYLSYAIAALLVDDWNQFCAYLTFAKQFDTKRFLIYILYQLRNWPGLLKTIIVLYKKMKLWIKQHFENNPFLSRRHDKSYLMQGK